MKKIASPQHLAIHIRRLLAYCQGPDKPSREVLAQELRRLARQVSDFDVDWQDFQGEYLNPVGMLLHKGKKWGWEEVDADKMGALLKDAAGASARHMGAAGSLGKLFKQMADRLGQAKSLLSKGMGGSTVADNLMGWKLSQFEQLVGEGLKAGAALRRQLDA